MRRLTAAGLLPERAGQPVKAWVHISLADLLLLDGDSALQEQWTEQVRARWAARRAAASETGASDGAWLGGDAAAAIACDAAMAPVVTGDVNVDALEDLVRLCVELDRLRRGGDGPDAPAADTTAAWAALEQAVIGKAVDLLSGPGGLASFLRRRQLGVRLGGPSLPLDIGYAESIPAGIRNAVHPAGPALPVGRRLHPARRRLRSAPHHAQGRRRQDVREGLRAAVPVPPPGRDSPVGLDAGREPGRDDQRVEQEQDQGAPQPRTTRQARVRTGVQARVRTGVTARHEHRMTPPGSRGPRRHLVLLVLWARPGCLVAGFGTLPRSASGPAPRRGRGQGGGGVAVDEVDQADEQQRGDDPALGELVGGDPDRFG